MQSRVRLRDISFDDDGNGIILGEEGTFLTSSNNGRTWNYESVEGNYNFTLIQLKNKRGVVVDRTYRVWTLVDVKFLIANLPETYETLISTLKRSLYREVGIQIEVLLRRKKLVLQLRDVQKDLDNNVTQKNTERLIVRGAALAIIMFLVQILITNYRYMSKLRAFYRARAQALKIVRDMSKENGDVPDVSALMTALTPDTEFGRSPSAISETVVAMVPKSK